MFRNVAAYPCSAACSASRDAIPSPFPVCDPYSIVSALAVNGSLRFTDLRDLLGITDGNLKSHANRLEAARYIECAKSFEGNGPKTEYSLTRTGREELQAYLGHMEAIIRATRDATEQ